jgi:hypothetical protein
VSGQKTEVGGLREDVGGWRSAALEVGGKGKIIADFNFEFRNANFEFTNCLLDTGYYNLLLASYALRLLPLISV